MEFTQQEILQQTAIEFDEVFVDMRKGIAQTKYIALVKDDAEVWIEDKCYPVPDEYKGFWMMEWQDNLQYVNFSEAIREYEWVKCEQKEVVSIEYVEV